MTMPPRPRPSAVPRVNPRRSGVQVVALLVLAGACAETPPAPEPPPEPPTQGLRIELGQRLRAEPHGSISIELPGDARAPGLSIDPRTSPDVVLLPAAGGLRELRITYRAGNSTTAESLPVFVPAADFVDLTLDLPEEAGPESGALSGTHSGALITRATRVDLRGEIAARGLDVRNQGGRGTCSVFAMTFLLEYQYAGMFGADYADLSEEYLNYHAQLVVGSSSASHGDGAFFWMVQQAFDRYGAVPEGTLPYAGVFDFDADAGRITPELVTEARARRELAMQRGGLAGWFLKPNDPRNVLTEEEFQGIKDALRLGLPVAMGRGHSVVLVGFDDRSQVFLYRNSYGAGFGEQGYGTYSYADIRGNCFDLYVNFDTEAGRFLNRTRTAP